MKKIKNVLKKGTAVLSIVTYQTLVSTNIAFANAIEESSFVKGILRLINDVIKVLLLVIPLVAGVWIMIESLKIKACEDDGEVKPHKRKIRTILIYAIVGESASIIVTTILSYFQ